MTHRIASLAEIRGETGWAGIRSHFEIAAFGINASTALEDGDPIVPEHDEIQARQEELYLVLEGHATFTVDGEEVDAPAGTIVHVGDPTLRRGATGKAGTTILAVGGTPGEPYTVTGWDTVAEVFPMFARGEYAAAKAVLEAGVARYPGQAGMLYNLACAEARLGEHDTALEHLREAVELSPRFAGLAQADDDLASIRDDPGFPAAPEEAGA